MSTDGGLGLLTRRHLAAALALGAAGCRSSAKSDGTPSKKDRFAEKMMEDLGAGLRASLTYIGDRLGIFKAMAGSGAVTAAELAASTRLNGRYVRAWLEAMTAAEYLEYDAKTKRFLLPPEHAALLADEESPEFMGGAMEFVVPAVMATPKVQDAFRTGRGVSYSDYAPELFEAIARWSAPGFKHQLVQKWIPAMPDVERRLREGANAADVGCGQGLASIVMAKAFPRSRFWGFDPHGPSIERAREAARVEGVGDRVTFEVVEGARVPERKFDFVSTFDVLHDSADPVAIVRAMRTALAGGGTYLASEPSLSPRLEDNITPMGRAMYAATLLYCMSVSLGQGGSGIGADINDEMVQQWGIAAGFRSVRKLPIEGGGFVEMRV